MSHPDGQPEHAQPYQPAQDALPPVQAEIATLALAVDEMNKLERRRRRGRLGRRALFATAGLGVCAAGVAATPWAVGQVEHATKQDVQDAFNAGINAGRQALLDELAQLEGITIEGAIGVAEITRLGIRYLVLPLAQLTATLGGFALQALTDGILSAQSNLSTIHVSIAALDQLAVLLGRWRTNVASLPITIDAYSTADIDSAEKYLKALQKTLHDQQAQQTAIAAATPARTATPQP